MNLSLNFHFYNYKSEINTIRKCKAFLVAYQLKFNNYFTEDINSEANVLIKSTKYAVILFDPFQINSFYTIKIKYSD